jgi:WD40 repeat protein
VYGGIIKIWIKSAKMLSSDLMVVAPENLEDTRFNNNGSSILALANASSSAYVFEVNGDGTYDLTQTVDFDSKPLSLCWASKSNFTVFGMEDGSVRVYSKSNGNWISYENITHTGAVIGLACSKSRILSYSSDCKVIVWYHNLTTGKFN